MNDEPNDDALLDALGALAREREQRLPDQAHLEALAAGDPGDDDPAARAAFDALLAADPDAAELLDALGAPGDGASDRFAAAALAAFAADGPSDVEASDGPAIEETAHAPAAPDNVLPFRRPRAWIITAGTLAAAAAILFFLMRPSAPPLPEYTATVTGGRQLVRGAEADGVPRLGPDERLSLILTPAVAPEGPLETRAFVIAPDGAAHRWDPPREISEQGAVRIAGTGRALRLFDQPARGSVILRIFVGRPAALPAEGDRDAGAGWQRFDIAVQLTP